MGTVSEIANLGDSKSSQPPTSNSTSKPRSATLLPSARKLTHGPQDVGARHSIGLPIHVYPLYENATRARRGQSMAENNDESAGLYEDFARVAAGNTAAWGFGREAATREEIGTVTRRNRMICFPCE